MTDQNSIRVGLGHDSHRLEPGRPFVVGGVVIEHDRGPVGHSDGDVLLHAITDALLGAAGLGDIGQWFPDSDSAWKNADSARFVESALAAVQERGWKVGNVDATIFAERPKFAPHREKIIARVAELLGVSREQVNVKAKTGEKVGPIGREEAIAADTVILLIRAH